MTGKALANESIRLSTVVEGVALIAMAFAALAIAGTILGRNGLSITDSQFADQRVITLPVELNFPVDFGDRLTWVDGSNGTIDESTGLGPVELSGPVVAQLGFWGPTTSQRYLWLTLQIAGQALALAGLWQVFGIAKSTRTGDPFTLANEKRLWRLAAVVAIGGSLYLWVGAMAHSWIVGQSAASSFVDLSVTFSFMPIIAGISIAALASIWHVGVEQRDQLVAKPAVVTAS